MDPLTGTNPQPRDLIVGLQAKCRGWLVRRAMFNRLERYYRHEDDIIKVQALWRGRQTRQWLASNMTRIRKEMPPLS